MPLYIGDYLRDTLHLTTTQHGAYLLLLFAYWTTGPLPDEDERLAAITKASLSDWKKMRPTMEWFFTIECGTWHQKRADEEIKKASILSTARSNAGKVAAMRRWDNKRIPDALGYAVQTHTPSPSPSPVQPQVQPPPHPDSPSGGGVADEERNREPAGVELLVLQWNGIEGLTSVRVASRRREVAFNARMKDKFFKEHWQAALTRIAESNFCKGNGTQGWHADIDWFLKPDTCAKIMEGKYDNRTNSTSNWKNPMA